MRHIFRLLFIAAVCTVTLSSCKDECKDTNCLNGGTCVDGTCDCPDGFSGANCETDTRPQLVFKFQFDSTQVRLGNLGNPEAMPAGHAGQSPLFHAMSAHYVELAPDQWTQLGQGEVLYRAAETTAGGSLAIDFDSAKTAGPGEVFLSIPLADVAAGTYDWLRVSLAYQKYDVTMQITSPVYNGAMNGQLASFVGFNTYIRNYEIDDTTISVNGNRSQGYWGFKTDYTFNSGQAPGTTVPNPIASTSPIPAGSCVVTGEFASPFTVTGNETEDIVVVVSLSINKSFEWQDDNGNGLWDVNVGAGTAEQVTDMGVRGLIPIVQ